MRSKRSRPRLKELLRLLLVATESVRGGHQFLCLGCQEGAEEGRVDPRERVAEPDVEEVGEVGVADVVVVGRVGARSSAGAALIEAGASSCSLTSSCQAPGAGRRPKSSPHSKVVPRFPPTRTERVNFRVIPRHRHCVPTKGATSSVCSSLLASQGPWSTEVSYSVEPRARYVTTASA